MNAPRTASFLGRKAAATLRPRAPLPQCIQVAATRTYSTSVARYATIVEDYDAYTLHGTPQEPTQCDLGAIVDGPVTVVETPVTYYGEEPVWSLATFEPFWKSMVESEPEEEVRGKEMKSVELRTKPRTASEKA
jgi:hypothetical protein